MRELVGMVNGKRMYFDEEMKDMVNAAILEDELEMAMS